MNILLVEDDELLAESARLGLSQRGFVVDWIDRLNPVRQKLKEGDYRCLLLDLSLPDGDGLVLLRRLREQGNTLPVIIITARYDLKERIKGLELGADDYLTKPYALDELAARIRAVMRRWEGRSNNVLTSGDIVFDPQACKVVKHGQVIELSGIELRLLRFFMENMGKIQNRTRLLKALRVDGANDNSSNRLEVHIHHLRKKLGAEKIKTVRGMGYMFLDDDT